MANTCLNTERVECTRENIKAILEGYVIHRIRDFKVSLPKDLSEPHLTDRGLDITIKAVRVLCKNCILDYKDLPNSLDTDLQDSLDPSHTLVSKIWELEQSWESVISIIKMCGYMCVQYSAYAGSQMVSSVLEWNTNFFMEKIVPWIEGTSVGWDYVMLAAFGRIPGRKKVMKKRKMFVFGGAVVFSCLMFQFREQLKTIIKNL